MPVPEYSTESTSSTPHKPRPRWLAFGIAAAIANLLAIGLAILGGAVIPQFAKVFTSFGADLPWPTQFLIEHPLILCLAIPASLVLTLAGLFSRYRNQVTSGLAIFSLIELLAVPVCIAMLYLPIVKMGQIS
jgi:hypothetical protein